MKTGFTHRAFIFFSVTYGVVAMEQGESQNSVNARGQQLKVHFDTATLEQQLLTYGSSRSMLVDLPIDQVAEHVYSPRHGLMSRIPKASRLVWARDIPAYIEQERGTQDRKAFQREKTRLVARSKKRQSREEALQAEMEEERAQQGINQDFNRLLHPLFLRGTMTVEQEMALAEEEFHNWGIDVKSFRNPKTLADEMERRDGLSASIPREQRSLVMTKLGDYIALIHSPEYRKTWSVRKNTLSHSNFGVNVRRHIGGIRLPHKDDQASNTTAASSTRGQESSRQVSTLVPQQDQEIHPEEYGVDPAHLDYLHRHSVASYGDLSDHASAEEPLQSLPPEHTTPPPLWSPHPADPFEESHRQMPPDSPGGNVLWELWH